MRARRILASLCCAAAAACGDDGGTEPPPPPEEVVATVTVTGPAGESVPGDELQLVATARNEEQEEIPEAEITWASSSEAIASVSAAGLVTANAPGNATITASSGGKRREVGTRDRIRPERGRGEG